MQIPGRAYGIHAMRQEPIREWTTADLRAELDRGTRFLRFEYCISFIFITFRRPGPLHLVRQGQRGLAPLLKYSLLSLFLGWWGVPWGLIYTPLTLVTNLTGGCDVTKEVETWLRTSVEPDRM